MTVTYMKIFKYKDLKDYIPSEYNPSNRVTVYKEIHLPEADRLEFSPMYSIPIEVQIQVAKSELGDFTTDSSIFGIGGIDAEGYVKSMVMHPSFAMQEDYFIEKRRVVDDFGNTHYKTYLLIGDTSNVANDETKTYIVTYSLSESNSLEQVSSKIVLQNGLVKYEEQIPTTNDNNELYYFSSVTETSGQYVLSFDANDNEYEVVTRPSADTGTQWQYYRIPLDFTAFEEGELKNISEKELYYTDFTMPINVEVSAKIVSSVGGMKTITYSPLFEYLNSRLQILELEYINGKYIWVLYVGLNSVSPVAKVEKYIISYNIITPFKQYLTKQSYGETLKTGEHNHSVIFDKQIQTLYKEAYFFQNPYGGLAFYPSIQVWMPELSSNNLEDFFPTNTTIYQMANVNGAAIIFYPKDRMERTWLQAKDLESEDWHWYVLASCPKWKIGFSENGNYIYKDTNDKAQERLILSYRVKDYRSS